MAARRAAAGPDLVKKERRQRAKLEREIRKQLLIKASCQRPHSGPSVDPELFQAQFHIAAETIRLLVESLDATHAA